MVNAAEIRLRLEICGNSYSGCDMIFCRLPRGAQSGRFNCRGFRSTQIHSPFCKMKRGTARSGSIVGSATG